MKIRAIITGATGMVGEGVLHECLQDPNVESVLIINRKPYGRTHPKLKEIVHGNFFDLTSVEAQLVGYNACYFCLGVSSIGMKEPEYRHLTYDLTLNFAKTVSRLNPDMVFCYVSGASTDSTENGKMMWARIKGKTENDLMKLPFKKVYAFRPGMMKPTPGLKNTLPMYVYLNWLYPIVRFLSPASASSLAEVGQAMIRVTERLPEKSVLEVKDFVAIANA